MRKYLVVGLFLAIPLLGTPNRGTAADKQTPQEKPRPVAVKVVVDTTEVPDLADWGQKAKELVAKWHPLIADLLKSDGFTPPAEVKLVFKKNMKGVAYTQGTTIVIAAHWIKKHPDDFGMVAHELTHVIQAYGPSRQPRPFWLVEGIADYIRFSHYEPKTKVLINPRRASYRDGYRTAALFLAWVEKSHARGLVRKLNEALRKGQYKDELFKTYTSRTLDELWKAFLASLEKK